MRGDALAAQQHLDSRRRRAEYSWPSPFVSVSMSFAVAADYATSGGHVYEIDLSAIPAHDLFDPIEVLAKVQRVHKHDAHQMTLKGLVDPSLAQPLLTTYPLRPHTNGTPLAKAPAPNISSELIALVNAVRDAELLVRSIPSKCVGAVYAIP